MASGRIAASIASRARPYPPSWVDGLQVAVERSPTRMVAFYVGLPAILYLAMTAAHWLDGTLAWGRFQLFHAVPPLTLALSMACMHWLDRCAVASLRAFRPALHLPDEDVAELEYRLTNLPRGETRFAAAWGLAIAAIGLLASRSLELDTIVILTSPLASSVEIGVYLAMWVALAAFMYHSKHQLLTVHHIYRHCTQVHIFRLEPIYSFSWLTGRTAIGLVLVGYLWFFTSQDLYRSGPYLIAYQVVFSLLAAVAFAWPLWGMHRVLAREKRRASDELGAKLERALERLYAAVDQDDLTQIDGLNKLIASLSLTRAELERISTWPWRPDTSRLLVTTLLLPLVVYLAQRALSSQLGV